MPYLLRKFLFLLLTLWAAVTLNFVLPRLVPGDPIGAMLAKYQGKLDPSAVDALTVAYGLNDQGSLLTQYVTYLGHMLRGDFGRSIGQFPTPVVDIVAQAAPWTIGLVGVCTGSFVLSRIGLMRERRCCVSWYHHRDYLEEFPDHEPVADQLYVVDRDRITCSGGAGVADLAAFLIERHLGAACAQKTMHILLIDKARPPGQSQPQPPTSSEPGGGAIVNDRVRRALLLMEQNLSPPLSVEQIARRLSVSTRQFERLFREATGMNPTGFYRILRLRYGHWLLRNSARSVTSIALETGFADCAHFSRQFREIYGISPSELRRDGPPPEPAALTEGLSAVEALALDRDLVPPDRRLFE